MGLATCRYGATRSTTKPHCISTIIHNKIANQPLAAGFWRWWNIYIACNNDLARSPTKLILTVTLMKARHQPGK